MARANPGSVVFATPPTSSIAQLSGTVISQATDTKFNFVPFSRSSDSLAAVTSGDAMFFVDAVSVVLPFVRALKVQPIAVLSSTWLPGLEEFPLASETVPGLEVAAGFGLVASNQVDPAVVEAMFQATSCALQAPHLVRKFQDMAIFLRVGGPDVYRANLRREAEFWGKVIRTAHIRPE